MFAIPEAGAVARKFCGVRSLWHAQYALNLHINEVVLI